MHVCMGERERVNKLFFSVKLILKESMLDATSTLCIMRKNATKVAGKIMSHLTLKDIDIECKSIYNKQMGEH